ncbi:YhgE/Pip domain-containing protein [Corynebacterium bovis]|uniref:YhgE/Pip domain-containing protein n=1 Tax=Corynebacterium bovis TaxID=36808 RepID=UPI0031386962
MDKVKGLTPHRGILGYNSEIRRFRAYPAMLVVVVLIPLFYGGMFLWSFWNPTENIDNMKVALVNEDRPAAAQDGTPIDAGTQFVDKLVTTPSVDWDRVSAAEAAKGVEDGTYFASLTVPADFSRSVATVATDHPVKAPLDVQYNDANGGTAGTILESVMQRVHATLSQTIGAQSADKLFVSLGTIHDRMGEAADGSNQLVDGAHQLDDGITQQLAPGVDELQSKVGTELAPGARQLADKVHGQLAPGVTELNSKVTGELAPGVRELHDKVHGQLAPGAQQLADGNRELQQKLGPVLDNPLAMQIPAVRDLVDGINQLADGSAQLNAGIQNDLADGVDRLDQGVNGDLVAGVDRLDQGVNGQLVPGVDRLADGITGELQPGANRLADGIEGQLVPGIAKLRDGTTQLRDGSGRLLAGTTTLRDGITEGRDQVPAFTEQTAQANGDVVGSPVDLRENWLHKQMSYGEGVAPYFLPLALFIGGIFIWQALRPINRRHFAAPVSATKAVLHSFRPAMLLCVVQVAVLVGVLLAVSGLSVSALLPWLGVTVLAAFSFAAFQQAAAVVAGDAPGRFVSIVYLILNLATAGGTYPSATLPSPLKELGPLLPFYHVGAAMRETLTGGVGQGYWIAVGYLLLLTLGSLAVSVVAAAWRRVYTVGSLHPAIRIG